MNNFYKSADYIQAICKKTSDTYKFNSLPEAAQFIIDINRSNAKSRKTIQDTIGRTYRKEKCFTNKEKTRKAIRNSAYGFCWNLIKL